MPFSQVEGLLLNLSLCWSAAAQRPQQGQSSYRDLDIAPPVPSGTATCDLQHSASNLSARFHVLHYVSGKLTAKMAELLVPSAIHGHRIRVVPDRLMPQDQNVAGLVARYYLLSVRSVFILERDPHHFGSDSLGLFGLPLLLGCCVFPRIHATGLTLAFSPEYSPKVQLQRPLSLRSSPLGLSPSFPCFSPFFAKCLPRRIVEFG